MTLLRVAEARDRSTSHHVQKKKRHDPPAKDRQTGKLTPGVPTATCPGVPTGTCPGVSMGQLSPWRAGAAQWGRGRGSGSLGQRGPPPAQTHTYRFPRGSWDPEGPLEPDGTLWREGASGPLFWSLASTPKGPRPSREAPRAPHQAPPQALSALVGHPVVPRPPPAASPVPSPPGTSTSVIAPARGRECGAARSSSAGGRRGARHSQAQLRWRRPPDCLTCPRGRHSPHGAGGRGWRTYPVPRGPKRPLQSSEPSRALWGESWTWSQSCTLIRTAPRAVEGPSVPLEAPLLCSGLGGHRPAAPGVGGLAEVGPQPGSCLGAGGLCLQPRDGRGTPSCILALPSPHPHSPAAPQCPGRQRAQGGRGHPAMNMEEMAVSRVKGGLSQPLDARGLAPHFMAESPRPRRQGSPPGRGSLSHGLCSSEVPSHPPRLLPAGVGPSAAHRAVWPLAPH